VKPEFVWQCWFYEHFARGGGSVALISTIGGCAFDLLALAAARLRLTWRFHSWDQCLGRARGEVRAATPIQSARISFNPLLATAFSCGSVQQGLSCAFGVVRLHQHCSAQDKRYSFGRKFLKLARMSM